MKLIQEIIKAGMVRSHGNLGKIRIKKYHISRNGTARKNKLWDFYRSKHKAENKHEPKEPTVIFKKEIEVKKITE